MRKILSKLLIGMTIISMLPLQAIAQATVNFTGISNENPAMNESVTVFGADFQSGEFTAVIYPQGADLIESNFHYPEIIDWQPELMMFQVGTGSGIPLEQNKAYTYNLLFSGDTLSPGINFTIAGEPAPTPTPTPTPTPSPTPTPIPSCTDTDPSDNDKVKGNAKYDTQDLWDYCGEDDKTLYQAQCSSTTIASYNDGTQCQYGCFEGVCKDTPSPTPTPTPSPTATAIPSCTDTDPSDDTQVKGNAKYDTQNLWDYCGEDDKTLYQAQCSSTTIASYNDGTQCQYGCFEGVCKVGPTPTPTPSATAAPTPTPTAQASTNTTTPSPSATPSPTAAPDSEDEFENAPTSALQTQEEGEEDTETQKKTITSLFNQFDQLTQQPEQLATLQYTSGLTDFKDVPKNEWFFGPINRLHNIGAVSGYVDENGKLLGEFKPARQVGVDESLKIILESSGNGKKAGGTPKNQLAQNTWSKEYFAKADDLGLAAANLAPGKKATRAEIACMIQKTFKLPAATSTQLNFADLKSNHKDFNCIQSVFAAGIMKGGDNDNKFRPNDGINRAEMSIVIDRSLEDFFKDVKPWCPEKKDWQNILIYETSAERIDERNGDPKIVKGHYYVKYKVGILNTHFTKDMTGVDLDLFRHDIVPVGNDYEERIVQLKTPTSWKNATVTPGRYKYFEAIVPVPVKTYQAGTYTTGGQRFDMARITVAIDLPQNKIAEIIDVSDNVGTTRVMLGKYNNTKVAGSFSNRTIELGNDTKTTVSGRIAEKFLGYNVHHVNSHKPYRDVLSSHFRKQSQTADSWSKSCLNYTVQPGSFQVTQKSVGKDETELTVKAKIVKEGKIDVATHMIGSGRVVLYAREKGSKKPPQAIDWWSLESPSALREGTDKGDKDKVIGEIAETSKIPTRYKNVELSLVVDSEDQFTERNEKDNTAKTTLGLTGTSLAACNISADKFHDLEVKNFAFDKSTISKTATGDYKVRISAQLTAKNKDAEKVNLHLFEAQMAKDNFGQLKETLKEINVPDAWKTMRLTKDKTANLTADIVVDGDSVVFSDSRKSLGVRLVIAVDLADNTVQEVDEIGNNIVSTFIDVDTAQSTGGKYYDVEALKNFIRVIKPASANQYSAMNFKNDFASDMEFPSYDNEVNVKKLYDTKKKYEHSLKDFYVNHHKIKSVDTQLSKLCTNLKLDSFTIKQAGTTDRSIVVHINAAMSKIGPFPLPAKFNAAQLYYRPANSNNPYRIAYTWDNSELTEVKAATGPIVGGIAGGAAGSTATSNDSSNTFNNTTSVDTSTSVFNTSHTKKYTLAVTGLKLAPYNAQYATNTFDFKLVLDPDNEIDENTETDNEDESKYQANIVKNVDLAVGDLSFGKVYLDNGQPKVDLSYEIVNSGSQDVTTEFKVEFGPVNNVTEKKYLFKDSWSVFEVKNGKFSGKRTLTLPQDFRRDHHYRMVVDVNKDILDADYQDNTILWKKTPLVLEKDLATYITVVKSQKSKGRMHKLKTSYQKDEVDTLEIDIQFEVEQLAESPGFKKLYEYVWNSQKFPLSFTSHTKPFDYFKEPLYLRKYWFGGLHNWKYEERVENDGLVYRAGIVRVDCSTQCGYKATFDDGVKVNATNGSGISRGFFGDDHDKNQQQESYNNRPYHLTLYPSADRSDYSDEWDWTHRFEVPQDDATYIIYGGLLKHWTTHHVTNNSTNGVQDLPVHRTSSEWMRVVERPYQDPYTANNSNFIKIVVKNGTIASIAQISAGDAHGLAAQAGKKLDKYIATDDKFKSTKFGYFPWGFEDILKAYYSAF